MTLRTLYESKGLEFDDVYVFRSLVDTTNLRILLGPSFRLLRGFDCELGAVESRA